MSLALRVTQPAPACSEHDLVAAVRRGNDRAFEELYARYRSRIGSYIFGMVGDHGRAEDIAQEVFISALRRLRETERAIIFKPWIYEIAKNACIDEFRRTRRIHEVPLEPESDHEFSAALPSTSPTPDAAVESKQRLTDLTGAFRGLSESHHRILVLRELEGLSYNQIGARLGMTKPVVESTLFRARRRLGEEFEDLESGRRCQRVQSLIASVAERPLRSLGIRERRQFARHVAHCEPCLRQAREAGVDESLYRAPNLLGRMAILAPLPWLRSLVPYLDPSGPGSGVGRALATAAVVVAGAGAGGGIVLSIPRHPSRPASAAIASTAVGATSATATRVARADRRTDRSGAAASGNITVGHFSTPATRSAPVLGIGPLSLAPTQTRAQPRTVGAASGGGSTTARRPAAGSPAGSGRSGGLVGLGGFGSSAGSAGPGPSQPSGGPSQATTQSGAPAATTPSSGVGGLNLGQTVSGTVGAVNQGLNLLPPVPAPSAGGTGTTSTSAPSLPGLPPGASGSAGSAPATGGTSSPSSPAQPAGSGATTTTSAPSLQGGAGATGASAPTLGP